MDNKTEIHVERESIYSSIQKALSSDGYLPSDGGEFFLPDHDLLDSDSKNNYVPGEFEAVYVRLPYALKEKAIVNFYLASRLAKIINDPKSKSFNKTLKMLRKYEAVTIADPVLSQLTRFKVNKDKARAFAIDLVTRSPFRNIVKLGIVLLGYYGKPEDCKYLKILAIHEEFTFFAIKAIHGLDSKREYQNELIYIGDRVKGWGKIAVILEFDDGGLTENTTDWLLRFGCFNYIALFYTACECAIKGQLVQTLAAFDEEIKNGGVVQIDDELTAGICDILEGLIYGSEKGNADGIDEVPGANKMAEYLHNLRRAGAFGNDSRLDRVVKEYRAHFGVID